MEDYGEPSETRSRRGSGSHVQPHPTLNIAGDLVQQLRRRLAPLRSWERLLHRPCPEVQRRRRRRRHLGAGCTEEDKSVWDGFSYEASTYRFTHIPGTGWCRKGKPLHNPRERHPSLW